MIVGHYAAAVVPYSRLEGRPLWLLLVCANVPEFLWLALALAGVEPTSPASLLDATFPNIDVHMTYSHNFSGSAGDYASSYGVGDDPIEERRGLSQYGLMQQVEFWLNAVRRDVETPDLWAQLQRPDLFAAVSAAADGNTPFTAEEQEDIAVQMQALRQHSMLVPGGIKTASTQICRESGIER